MRIPLGAVLAGTAAISLLVACKRPVQEVDLSQISLGMTKQEVTDIIGAPTRVSVKGHLEIFEYEAYDTRETWNHSWVKENFRYSFVRFIEGKVESFGSKGDFDSTKNPTTEQKIDLKISGTGITGNISTPPTEKFDLATELKKLEQLKKDGLLKPEEYEMLRQRAIEKAKLL